MGNPTLPASSYRISQRNRPLDRLLSSCLHFLRSRFKTRSEFLDHTRIPYTSQVAPLGKRAAFFRGECRSEGSRERSRHTSAFRRARRYASLHQLVRDRLIRPTLGIPALHHLHHFGLVRVSRELCR